MFGVVVCFVFVFGLVFFINNVILVELIILFGVFGCLNILVNKGDVIIFVLLIM